MHIQTTEPAVGLIQTRIKATKKRGAKTLSVGSVFRDLRENEGFSFFGDYPLLAIVVDEIKKGGFSVRRDTLFKVMAASKELSELRQGERTALVDQMLEPHPEHSRRTSPGGTIKENGFLWGK